MTRMFSQKLQRKLKQTLCTYMHICLTCNNGITNTEAQMVLKIQTQGLENTGNQSIPQCMCPQLHAHNTSPSTQVFQEYQVLLCEMCMKVHRVDR